MTDTSIDALIEEIKAGGVEDQERLFPRALSIVAKLSDMPLSIHGRALNWIYSEAYLSAAEAMVLPDSVYLAQCDFGLPGRAHIAVDSHIKDIYTNADAATPALALAAAALMAWKEQRT